MRGYGGDLQGEDTSERGPRGVRGALLCAGLGTRLRPLTDERPKPLVPVCDVPLAGWGLRLLARVGVARVGVNLHHLGDRVRAALGDEVVYSEEREILGTGGGLVRLAELLDLGDDDLVVVNGKVILDVDLAEVIARHRESGALATMVVREDPDARRWGAIDVGEDGRVRGLLGAGRHMFCGVHVVRPEFLRALPRGASDSVRHGYVPLVERGAPVVAFVARGWFAEHSTPARYLASNRALVAGAHAGRPRVAWAEWPLAGVDAAARVEDGARVVPPVLVGPRALVERGARVGPEAVVGAGAVVARGATVERAVVWDGARAQGDARDAIVTQRGIVRVE